MHKGTRGYWGERAAAEPPSTGRMMLCRGLHSQVAPGRLLHPVIPPRVTLKASRRERRSEQGKGPRLYHADGHYFVVSARRLPSDGTGGSQVFHPKSIVLPDDVQKDVPAGKAEPWWRGQDRGKHSLA